MGRTLMARSIGSDRQAGVGAVGRRRCRRRVPGRRRGVDRSRAGAPLAGRSCGGGRVSLVGERCAQVRGPRCATSRRACRSRRRSPRRPAWRAARRGRRRPRRTRRRGRRTRGRSGVARSARSSTASRIDSRIAVAVAAPLDVPLDAAPSAGLGAMGVAGRAAGRRSVGPGEGLVGPVRLARRCGVVRLGHGGVLRWSGGANRRTNRRIGHVPKSCAGPQSSDSGSTSTDHGASTPPSSSADRIVAAQDDVPAPAVRPSGDVGGGRADDGHRDSPFRGTVAQPVRHRLRLALGGGRIRQPDRQLDQPPERRRAEPLAQRQLGVVEGRRGPRSPRPGSPGGRAGRSGRSPGPAASPRPARPIAWTSSWYVRSAARSSGRLSATSDETTPTSVTDGMSRPLVTRLVPTRTSSRPVGERVDDPLRGAAMLDDVAVEPRRRAGPGTSRAPRARRARSRRRGSGSAASRTFGQRDASGVARPQWWQRSVVPAWW